MSEKDKTALEIGPRFVQETSYYDFSQTGRRKGEPQPIPFWTAEKGMETVLLPPWQQALPSSCLWTAMEKRRSRRTYAQEALEIQALSCLCGVTQGIEKEIVFNGNATLRPVPSAGAKHAIETIVLVRRVKGLAPGLYRYLAKEHALGWLGETTSDWLCALDTAFTSNRFQHNSAVTFFWIAVPERMVWHHGQRGYRNLYLDAGHIGQNFYLAAEGLGLAACTMCVFDDVSMKRLLGLEGDQFLVYTAAAGQRQPEPAAP